jgi:toluene methyl-monooxygenase electron transfer component
MAGGQGLAIRPQDRGSRVFGWLASKRAFRATIGSSGRVFEVEANETLLGAALRSGLAWRYSCRVGSCGTCRCRLVSGKIKELADFAYVLDDAELDAGTILACQTRLRSDITVEVELGSVQLAQPETTGGVIQTAQLLTHDIVQVVIALENPLPAYRAGQYAEIMVPGIEKPRSYSFACAPTGETVSTVTFHVRRVPKGEMSNWLHASNRVGAAVTVSGPHGTFYLRESEAPVLCVAGGSGMAPIKAVLEEMSRKGMNRPVTYLFGARTQKDLYCLQEMDAIRAKANGQFHFRPVLSEEAAGSDWSGDRGFVTSFIEQHALEVERSDAYLCGPPPMIDSAIEVLARCGLPRSRIYFDKFLDASHLPGGRR